MKKIIIVSSALCMAMSVFAQDPTPNAYPTQERESHGGNIVVNGYDRSLLDLLEFDFKSFYPRTDARTRDVFQKYTLPALSIFQKKIGKTPADDRKLIWVFTNHELERINDVRVIRYLPPGGVVRQLAVQKGAVVAINLPLYLELQRKPEHQGGLFLHEILIRTVIEARLNPKPTDPIRQLVGSLFDPNASELPEWYFMESWRQIPPLPKRITLDGSTGAKLVVESIEDIDYHGWVSRRYSGLKVVIDGRDHQWILNDMSDFLERIGYDEYDLCRVIEGLDLLPDNIRWTNYTTEDVVKQPVTDASVVISGLVGSQTWNVYDKDYSTTLTERGNYQISSFVCRSTSKAEPVEPPPTGERFTLETSACEFTDTISFWNVRRDLEAKAKQRCSKSFKTPKSISYEGVFTGKQCRMKYSYGEIARVRETFVCK